MQVEYKEVTKKDIDQVLRLFESKPLVYNTVSDDEFKNKFKNVLEEGLNDPLCFFPGIFVDGELYAFVFIKEIPSSPSWVWVYHILKPKSLSILVKPEFLNAFIDLDKAIYQELEVKRKLNRCYFVYPYDDSSNLRMTGSIERLWDFVKKSYKYDAINSRYKFFNDCFIEKNTLPKYQYQKELIGNRTWPIDLCVRIGIIQSNDTST